MKKAVIVGCGSIANVHAQSLAQLPDIELVAFADIIPEKASDFANKYTEGKAKVYSSLETMLDVEKPDVVHICTPHYLHVPMAIEAVKRGISFFSEKPPAISMEQFEELSSALHQANSSHAVHSGFCFQNRYNGTIKTTDELLATGKLGKVTGARAFVTWRRDENYYKSDWKGKLATEGGGALINQSIHTLDLLLRYLGKPVNVKASLSNHHLEDIIEVEDTVEAVMSFANGERACFYASTAYACDAPVILELQFERGRITIIDKTVTVYETDTPPQMINIEDDAGFGKNYWGNGHLTCIKDFYEKLDSDIPFQNDLAGVRNTMETMMKIYSFR